MKILLRHSLPFLSSCLLASAALVFANCGTTSIGARQSGKVAEGTWVPSLPSGYETIKVDGFTYYVHNGSYYIKRGGRFVAVPSPRSSLHEKRKITGQFQGGMPQGSHFPGRRI